MNDTVSRSYTVCSPPIEEYVGVSPIDPPSFRENLEKQGFIPFMGSYFHAFKYENEMYYEKGNYIRYYEDKKWQLHVRIFQTPSKRTYVFGHYEPSVEYNEEKHGKEEHIDTEFAESELKSVFEIQDAEFLGDTDLDTNIPITE